jgi:autotransporter-associated beta strand protein
VIPSGTTVSLNQSNLSGLAQAGTVNITSLTGGSLNLSNGDLSGTSINLVNLNTTAGTTLTASTGVTVAPVSGITNSIAGVLAGAGHLTKNGAGTLVLIGQNTYSGATNINAGVVSISADDNLGTVPGTTTANSLNINSGTLLVTDDVTLDSKRGISLGSNGGSFDVDATKTLIYGGAIANANTAVGSLTKVGSGVLRLSGANTYTGDTNINAGTLTLTGSLANATDVVMSNAAVWDLQAAQTVASLTMASGNSIINSSGTSALTVSDFVAFDI